MASDDIVFMTVMVMSIPLGHVVKLTKGAENKRILTGLIGAIGVIMLCHVDALHSAITVAVNCLIVKLVGKRYCHVISFVWCFGYLTFSRTSEYFGVPEPSPFANAVQLMLTLKMVTVAYEIHDSLYLPKLRRGEKYTDESRALYAKYVAIDPSIMDIIYYAYCYIGLVTGPFYRYRTYYDMLHNEKSEAVPGVQPILNRLKVIPIITTSFLLFTNYFSIEYAQSEEFGLHSLWYRIFYMMPMFVIFRTRLYVAFILGECMCMSAGLGAYPAESKPVTGQGPTNLEILNKLSSKDPSEIEYDFKTINNIDIYGTELAPTARDGLRSWNTTVQYFLAQYVYRRLPIKSIGPAVTMTVSGIWHGVRPGYYLSFLTVPPILIAEDIWINAYRKHATPEKQRLFDWVCWFFKMRFFDYMCMAFILLSWEATIAFWKSVYFIGHVFIVIFIISGLIVKSLHAKQKSKES